MCTYPTYLRLFQLRMYTYVCYIVYDYLCVCVCVCVCVCACACLFRNATLWTPMDCAAYNGHEMVVEVLIEAGADVNPTDKLQSIPLHLAAQEGHLNVVKVLLVNNADVGKCNSTNLNSLDLAIDNGHE